MYWRFSVPITSSVLRWGHGPSGGGIIATNKNSSMEGYTGEVFGTQVTWFGSGDRLSPGISAYVVFNDVLPDFVGFGLASEPFGQPGQMEIVKFQ